ncbi:MAG: alpha/beta hydrolase fold domain-containing protein, partial [Prosthecobacter sp.]|nr:alpha/beta hydrolase fold domain-containing protein [Prosthecobacter sp.]
KPNGTSVIVAPGGAYIFLSAVHEGTQVCEWLQSIGVTGILLKYRTPTRDEAAPHEKPVADAAQAIALVREHAKEWSLDPNRVGLLGFSAGGNLLAHIACDRPAAAALPNFGVMIYGGGFLDSKDPARLKAGFTVPADAPPLFIACAHDDGQNPVASTLLYLEYKKHKIPAELHLFTKGGHGFGMRDNKQPINAWPKRCAEWMSAMGWMPTVESLNALISAHQAQLDQIGRTLAKNTRCIDDLPILEREILSLAKRLKEARNTENEASLREMERRLDEMKAGYVKLEASLRSSVNLDKLGEDITRLKKEKFELEAERELLLKQQAKPGVP